MRNFIKRVWTSSFTRKVAGCLLILLGLQNIIVYQVYKLGEDHLDKNNPQQLQNRSETKYYFAPIDLQKSSEITFTELIEHLKDIAYEETKEINCEKFPSYSISGNTLNICSRYPKQFPNAILRFEKNRISTISVNNEVTERIQIEPLPMENAVVNINDTKINEGIRTRRLVLAPSGIPTLIIDAVTRTEDKRFFQHRGVNWFSVFLRPIISRGSSGGSSITQQLIKNNIVYGAKDEYWQTGKDFIDSKLKTPERKLFAELPMALAIENKLSKDEILAAYLSMNYMGNIGAVQLQGFEAASREFFDIGLLEISDEKDPSDLSKAAILSGMIQSPITYLKYVRNGEKCGEDEKKTCRNLLKRRNDVLDLMHIDLPEKYSKELIEKAKAQPLGFIFASKKKTERPIEFESRVFIKYAMENENLPSELQGLQAEESEVQVFTSLDARLQRDAVDVVSEYLKKIQPSIDEQTRKQRIQNSDKFDEIINRCNQQNTNDPEKCENLFQVKATLIAMDAQSGEILAMTSGIDADSKRSPGSLDKPFFYLKANETGIFNGQPFTPASFIDVNKDKSFLSQYCAEDENLGSSGIALFQLVKSENIGACVAAQSANIPADFVGSLTKSKPEKKLIASLGGTKGSESSLLDLMGGYSIFANKGKLIKPTAYKSAFQGEKSVFLSKFQANVRTNPEATFVTNEMMKSVITNGTASNFRQLAGLSAETQISGKTGSGMVADLWFIGLTPRIIVGVWVGMPNNFPLLRMKDDFTGGKIAVPLAAKFMRSVKKYRPDLLQGEFYQPDNVIKKQISQKSGCAVKNSGIDMFFIKGREPLDCK